MSLRLKLDEVFARATFQGFAKSRAEFDYNIILNYLIYSQTRLGVPTEVVLRRPFVDTYQSLEAYRYIDILRFWHKRVTERGINFQENLQALRQIDIDATRGDGSLVIYAVMELCKRHNLQCPYRALFGDDYYKCPEDLAISIYRNTVGNIVESNF